MRARLHDVWPELSFLFGLHPKDLILAPEEGGLTWSELDSYLDARERFLKLVGGAAGG